MTHDKKNPRTTTKERPNMDPLEAIWFITFINLEPFFSITPVDRFWLMKTYQYRCHPSVLSHHALGKTECDESYCIEGNHIWSFFRRGAGIFFIMSHTATRASSWPYMDFWTFKFFVTSVPGWGYAPIWEMGVYMHLYGPPSLFGFLGWIKCPNIYY
jgi:hypothetical protein